MPEQNTMMQELNGRIPEVFDCAREWRLVVRGSFIDSSAGWNMEIVNCTSKTMGDHDPQDKAFKSCSMIQGLQFGLFAAMQLISGDYADVSWSGLNYNDEDERTQQTGLIITSKVVISAVKAERGYEIYGRPDSYFSDSRVYGEDLPFEQASDMLRCLVCADLLPETTHIRPATLV